MSNKAFVDTTILADALLKQRNEGIAARTALKSFQETQLPVYAIKELKAGALRYYVWFHNKIVTTDHWADAVDAIRKIGATPQRNRLGTALQALTDFESSIGRAMPAALAGKYQNASLSEIKKAEARLWLRTLIFRAWKNRKNVTTRVVAPLSCYLERDLRIAVNGTIDDKPVRCSVPDCCMRVAFIQTPRKIQSLLAACDDLPDKPETKKRRKALRQLHRTPKRFLEEKDCVALGDAVFALQCPPDAVILTTNTRDHVPLAKAVGVSTKSPT